MGDGAGKGGYYDETGFYIGLGLALSSTIFIGASFIIKKKALLRINRLGSQRAANGGFGYLRVWLWWAGLLSMGVGELANFAAYAFAPASLVTPLGALSVLVSAVLSSYFLNEKLNLLGKMGCLLCVLGSTVIVIHAPHDEEVESIEELLTLLKGTAFVIYVSIIIVVTLVLAFFIAPRWGHRHVAVYIVLCSGVGSLTVMACKGFGLALKETFTGGQNELSTWVPWTFLVVVVICVMVQMNYLNKALDLFNTGIVTPVYYVVFTTLVITAFVVFVQVQMNYLNKALDLFNTGIVTPVYYVVFTTLVITASAILFHEWQRMSASDVIGGLCGFFVVIIATAMLNTFRDVDVTLSDVRGYDDARFLYSSFIFYAFVKWVTRQQAPVPAITQA